MRKFLISMLATCALALSMTAVGCEWLETPTDSSLDSSSSSTPTGELRNVTFIKGEGYDFTSNIGKSEGVIPEGTALTFTLDMGAFYTGSPVVYVNEKPVAPLQDGSYSIDVGAEDLTVRAEGVRKDVSNMAGTGAFDDAFVISKPIDLLYIAEQVNKGNTAYSRAAYVLANDIDCKGETLDIIGDNSTENSYFSGCVSCLTDQETGEMQRFTISNFNIESRDTNYVGLFGAVFADLGITSSGLFYGICIDNFTINAGVDQIDGDNKSVSVGGLIGYGVGANLFLCDATNGSINLTGDTSYFSFAGGLIGYQQGFYDPNYAGYFPSEIAYAVVDVDVNVLSGLVLYAGGVSGYLATNYPFGAVASVHNSYATGSVVGAIRSGGIAGGLGQYTVVSNCYATGNVMATSAQRVDDPLWTSDEFCTAHAGGIVGFAENDTVAHDSFFNGTLSAHAVSGNDYAKTNAGVGGGYEQGNVSIDSQKYLVIDCLENVDLSNEDYLTETLGWQSYDWIFEAGKLPVINYGTPEGGVTMSLTLHFVAKDGTEITVNKQKTQSYNYFDTASQSSNGYNAFGGFFATGSLSMYLDADNGYLSYGYFFDEACTKRVPYSYFPMKNLNVYVGFADPTPIVGTYTLVSESSATPLTVEFKPTGIVEYSDGVTSQEANYLFDGEKIVVEGARLARYYAGEIIVDETDTSVFADANFDLNRYSYFYFYGEQTDNGLVLYDGTYFTKDAPLSALKNAIRGEFYVKDTEKTTYYTLYGNKAVVETVTTETGAYAYAEYDVCTLDGDTLKLVSSSSLYPELSVSVATLNELDAFKGTWAKSATINKRYVFDGAGNWEYTHVSYTREGNGYHYDYTSTTLERAIGTYEINGDQMQFTHGGKNYVAKFNSNGFLEITDGNVTHVYYDGNSFEGKWLGSGFTLQLLGIGENGTGKATLLYDDGYVTELVYELSETTDFVALYLPHTKYWKDTLFGYFSFDVASNTLSAVLSDAGSATGYTAVSLYLYDDFEGDWICDAPELLNVDFHFNGLGLYAHLGSTGTLTLIEDGKETTVEYTLDSLQQGKFAYKGATYFLAFDEDSNTIKVTLGTTAVMQHKDEFANVEFVDLNGVSYVFDGRSTLQSTGGTLKVGDKTYGYKQSDDGYVVCDGETEVGSIVKGKSTYVLTIGETKTDLYITNDFMGDWAMNGMFSVFSIGPTDLNGKIKAVFQGANVELTVVNPATLTFNFKDGQMPITYYLLVMLDESLGENVLVLTEDPTLLSGEYVVCSKADDLFGSWESVSDNGKTKLSFDGVDSGYANSTARISLQLTYFTSTTDYYYNVTEKGIVMWSQALLAERTWYFKIVPLTLDEYNALENKDDVFVQRDKDGNVVRALLRIEVDGLYLTEAKDTATHEVYFFDGEGNMLVGDEVKYTYVIKSYNADSTATLEVVNVATSKKYKATLNYQNNANITFTLGEEITANA